MDTNPSRIDPEVYAVTTRRPRASRKPTTPKNQTNHVRLPRITSTIGLSKYGPGASIHQVPIRRRIFVAPSTMLSTNFVIA